MKITYKDFKSGQYETFEAHSSEKGLIGMRFKEVEMDMFELRDLINENRTWFETIFMTRFEKYPVTVKISANETN